MLLSIFAQICAYKKWNVKSMLVGCLLCRCRQFRYSIQSTPDGAKQFKTAKHNRFIADIDLSKPILVEVSKIQPDKAHPFKESIAPTRIAPSRVNCPNFSCITWRKGQLVQPITWRGSKPCGVIAAISNPYRWLIESGPLHALWRVLIPNKPLSFP